MQIKHLKFCQRLLKSCPIDEFSPNLVTLAGGNLQMLCNSKLPHMRQCDMLTIVSIMALGSQFTGFGRLYDWPIILIIKTRTC